MGRRKIKRKIKNIIESIILIIALTAFIFSAFYLIGAFIGWLVPIP